MRNERILTIVVAGLVLAFLFCLGIIGFLAAAPETRPIPDVLVGTTTGILGLLGGILVPSTIATGRVRNQGGYLAVFGARMDRATLRKRIGDPFNERGQIDPVAAALVALVVVVILVILVKFL